MESFVGKPLPRLEDERLLTGAGRYTADVDLPFAIAVTRATVSREAPW